MKYKYETDRLSLQVLNDEPKYAKQVLDFYSRNRDVFEPFDPARPENFYTESYQQTLLHCEHQLFMELKNIRYWVYLKSNPDLIIGTVCFHNILRSEFQHCSIGYKLDKEYWHKGLAKEAVSFLISRVFKELHLHRVEAFVMVENSNSSNLLRSLGFRTEGLCLQSAKIQGEWANHLIYALVDEEGE